ncbi:MAG: hypothetical protein OXE78_09460 [Gammaproteobacteria bacterium]|nr:hypothetical protein [Gammaproteobacteria bacterium]
MKQDEKEVLEEAKSKSFHVFSNGQMGVFLSVAAILISVNLWGFSSINTRIDDSVASINTRIDDVNTRIDDVNTRIDDSVASINTRIDDVNTRIDDLSMEVRTLRGEVVDVSVRVARIEGHLGLTTEVASVEYTDQEDALINPSAPLATTGN